MTFRPFTMTLKYTFFSHVCKSRLNKIFFNDWYLRPLVVSTSLLQTPYAPYSLFSPERVRIPQKFRDYTGMEENPFLYKNQIHIQLDLVQLLCSIYLGAFQTCSGGLGFPQVLLGCSLQQLKDVTLLWLQISPGGEMLAIL